MKEERGEESSSREGERMSQSVRERFEVRKRGKENQE